LYPINIIVTPRSNIFPRLPSLTVPASPYVQRFFVHSGNLNPACSHCVFFSPLSVTTNKLFKYVAIITVSAHNYNRNLLGSCTAFIMLRACAAMTLNAVSAIEFYSGVFCAMNSALKTIFLSFPCAILMAATFFFALSCLKILIGCPCINSPCMYLGKSLLIPPFVSKKMLHLNFVASSTSKTLNVT
jgi:hypothetical protein